MPLYKTSWTRNRSIKKTYRIYSQEITSGNHTGVRLSDQIRLHTLKKNELSRKEQESKIITDWIKLVKKLQTGQVAIDNQDMIKQTSKAIGKKIGQIQARIANIAILQGKLQQSQVTILSSNIDCLKKIASDLSNYKR